jgi:vancomycin resistance protein YoaR
MKSFRKALAGLALFTFTALQAQAALAEGEIVIIGTDGAEVADTTVPNGVYIGNISVGGMTAQQVGAAIDQYVSTISSMQLVVQSEKGNTQLPISEMSLSCNNRDEVIAAAIGQQHAGNLITQYKQSKDLECNNLHLELDFSVDATALAGYLITQIPDLECAAVNPSMYRDDNGEFVFVEGVNGFTIDYDGTYDAVCEALANYTEGSDAIYADVVGQSVAPAYDMSVFDGFGDVLGEWTTNYDASEAADNRATNVRLATSRINGTVLLPGETFSFCSAVQPFSAEGGYKDAGTYMDGQSVDALGGGVCQVSTTLYNAVLWAELDIPDGGRKPHSKSVDYVEPSMDAMVFVATGSDFQFTNSTEHVIYVEAYTGPHAGSEAGEIREDVTFRIYGTEYRPSNRTIDYESIVIEEELPDPVYKWHDDDSLAMYQEVLTPGTSCHVTTTYPHKYVKSKLIKHVYVDGVEEGEPIYLHTDTYASSSGEAYKNPKTTIQDIEYDPDTLVITSITFSNIYLDGSKTTTTQEETEKETEKAAEKETTEKETTEKETTQKETTKQQETTTEAAATSPAATQAPEETQPAATTEAPATQAPATQAPTTQATATTEAQTSAEASAQAQDAE